MKIKRLLQLFLLMLCLFSLISVGAMAEVTDMIILEYQPVTEAISLYAMNPPAPTEINANALQLKYDTTITKVTVYYQVGNNWVNIADKPGDQDLPAETSYRFDFTYNNISVDDLIAAGGQMIYEDLPDWFTPSGEGRLICEGKHVAQIEEISGKIVITFFDQEWLEEHRGKIIGGTFSVTGYVHWQDLPEDGNAAEVPGLGSGLTFERNLAQQYGDVDIEKTAPVVEQGADGAYYLKYVLTVTSNEDVAMPGVSVKDHFADSSYIEGYIGVSDSAADLPSADQGNHSPWENRAAGSTAGQVRLDENGDMQWNIGTLQPRETRSLTYCVQIAQDYLDELRNNSIQNQADVYADLHRKDTARQSFAPQIGVDLAKEATKVDVDPLGTGKVTYTVTITAPDTNTFTLTTLELKDALPKALADYLSGDQDAQITLDIEIAANGSTKSIQSVINYEDASFTMSPLPALEPGAVMTITYTVCVNNILLAQNGEIILNNTATVGKGDRILSSASDTKTLEKHNWARKLVGKPLDQTKTIETTGDDYYDHNGGNITPTDNPGQFTVPEGSLRYQVVLNENNQWDLSSTNMKDTLGSDYLRYAGYVQIQIYEKVGASGDTTDSALTSQLEKMAAVKTIWLKVDGENSFAFTPKDFGIDDAKNYTYLLTYYAKPVNMEKVGSVTVSNSFQLSGTVGDGNDGIYTLPGINLSISSVIAGGVKYNASKDYWYYEPLSQLYPTKHMKDGFYQAYDTDYENGALYWIIQLDGTIGSGKWNGGNSYSGFYVQDYPGWLAPAGKHTVKRDALIGIYKGPKGADLRAEYEDIADFAKAVQKAEDEGNSSFPYKQLPGNALDDKRYPETAVSNAVYKWYAESNAIQAILFPNGYSLEDDEALYIVLRTTPSNKLPTGTNQTITFTNNLWVAAGSNPVKAQEIRYDYVAASSLFKESKGAYLYTAEDGAFQNISDHKETDWHPDEQLNLAALPSSGIYAVWLLNVNWDGSMAGEAIVSDSLPAGMELVYVDLNNLGNTVKRNDPSYWPRTTSYLEWYNDPAWSEMRQTCSISNTIVETISYYNKETREIRWHIENLTKGSLKQNEMNLRIVCKVQDPELFLSQSKGYENASAILDSSYQPTEMANASVVISYPLDKHTTIDPGLLHSLMENRIPFEIILNQWSDDLCPGSTLPALIDELSSTIKLIEGSLKVTVNEIPYTNYSYTVREKNGQQTLIIEGLPDSSVIAISYDVRIDGEPNQPVDFSNKAYFAGYTPPDAPQVEIEDASYLFNGDAFTYEDLKITVIKVDKDTHSKRLDGAKFALYAVAADGTPQGDPLQEGVTDSYGRIDFLNPAGKMILKFNTVYCLEELTPPNSYQKNSGENANRYYMIIVDPVYYREHKTDLESIIKHYDDLKLELDVWYSSPEYEITVENAKATVHVNKVFADGTPTSGIYAFGLFDFRMTLLETLTIEYTPNDPIYKLNGVQVDSPAFSQHDPEIVYIVYELDAAGQPILDERFTELNGVYYYVTYSADKASAGDEVTVTNKALAQTQDESLTIFKTVQGQDANRGTPFTFEVELGITDAERTFDAKINPGMISSPLTFRDGKATVELKHGQCITISNLPVGTAYTVRELGTEDDYTTTVTGGSGTIPAEGATASFVNYTLQDGNVKTVDDEDGVVELGQQLVYTISWANNTADEAVVTITDVLDEGLTFVSASNSGALGADGRTVLWNLGRRPAYSSGSVTVTVTVNEKALRFDTLTNSATIEVGSEAHVATNTVNVLRGSLTVTKTVDGPGAEQDATAFTFTITLEPAVDGVFDDVVFEGGVAELTLSGGMSRTITGLPADFTYTVEETPMEGYTAAEAVLSGTIKAGETAVSNFLNTKDAPPPETGNLTVTKTVTGGEPDPDLRFSFTVTLEPAIDGTYGDVVFESGITHFTLAHNESWTVMGLPADITYTVEETPTEGYTAAEAVLSGTIKADETAVANFVNTKGALPPETGNLTVTKTVTGGEPDPDLRFSFTVTLDPAIDGTFGDVVFEGGITRFTLAHNESWTVMGLPADITYTVEETPMEGYIAAEAVLPGTIKAGATAVADFLNAKDTLPPEPPKTGNLTVTKTVTGGEPDPGLHFSFTVTLDPAIDGTFGDTVFEGGITRFTLAHNESRTVMGLPADITYTVEETPMEGYTAAEAVLSGTVTAGTTAVADFLNTKNVLPPEPPKTGNLTVTKTVTGGEPDPDLRFSFTVTLDPAIDGTFDDVVFEGGITRFTLAHNESRTVMGLPADITYTVEETPMEGYTATEAVLSGTIKAGVTAVANFFNTKGALPPETGSLTVTKTVTDGDRARAFLFRITLGDTNISGTYGDLTFLRGVAAFSLKHGESTTASGLPAGVTYTVEELIDEKDGYQVASTDATGVIQANQTIAALFTNTKTALPVPSQLTITKTVTGEGGDTGKAFSFWLMLGDKGVTGTYGDLTFTNGQASFTLAHGQSVNVTGLPAGTAYSILELEANQNGYVTTGYHTSGVITAGDSITANIVNAKDAVNVPQTGDDSSIGLSLMMAALAFTGIWLLRKRAAK